ncbi:MAG: hypothetical protein ACT4NX_04720 [Deltaproteobacteria bacterium]
MVSRIYNKIARAAAGKSAACLLSALAILAVLLPIVQNWKERPQDGFPLSYYPMFSAERSGGEKVVRITGYDSRGEQIVIHYGYAGTGGLNQVRRQIRKTVREGRAEELCVAVSRNLAASPKKHYARLETIQIVTSEYRFDDFFAGNKTPVSEKIHAVCAAKRDSI